MPRWTASQRPPLNEKSICLPWVAEAVRRDPVSRRRTLLAGVRRKTRDWGWTLTSRTRVCSPGAHWRE